MWYSRFLTFMGAAALLSACGGGDVNVTPELAPADAAALEASALNGLWTGDYTPTAGQPCTDVRGLILNGRVYAASADCDVILTGSLSVDSGSATASIAFDLFDADGNAGGSAGFTGSYTLKSLIDGSLDNGARLTLNYDIAYENDSAIAKVAGDWCAQGAFVQVDNAGNITGVATGGGVNNGCVYSGNIELIDSDYNLYGVTLSVDSFPSSASCPLTGNYTAVASVTEGAYALMTILGGNDQHAVLADFLRDTSACSSN